MILFAALIALWQYVKFSNGHGLFYLLSPKFGAYWIGAMFIIMIAFCVYAVWTEKLD